MAEVGNILFSPTELVAEFSDFFDLQMTWLKRRRGVMHGQSYLRETAATLWTSEH